MTTTNQQAIDLAITEASRNRTDYLQLCQRVVSQARKAGITEQEILDQIPNWFQSTGSQK